MCGVSDLLHLSEVKTLSSTDFYSLQSKYYNSSFQCLYCRCKIFYDNVRVFLWIQGHWEMIDFASPASRSHLSLSLSVWLWLRERCRECPLFARRPVCPLPFSPCPLSICVLRAADLGENGVVFPPVSCRCPVFMSDCIVLRVVFPSPHPHHSPACVLAARTVHVVRGDYRRGGHSSSTARLGGSVSEAII